MLHGSLALIALPGRQEQQEYDLIFGVSSTMDRSASIMGAEHCQAKLYMTTLISMRKRLGLLLLSSTCLRTARTCYRDLVILKGCTTIAGDRDKQLPFTVQRQASRSRVCGPCSLRPRQALIDVSVSCFLAVHPAFLPCTL